MSPLTKAYRPLLCRRRPPSEYNSVSVRALQCEQCGSLTGDRSGMQRAHSVCITMCSCPDVRCIKCESECACVWVALQQTLLGVGGWRKGLEDRRGEQMCPSPWMNYESIASYAYLSLLYPIPLAAGKSSIMKMSA